MMSPATFRRDIMRRQGQNPAYQRYAHLLPKSGRYPARDADIFWNLDVNQKITDAEVVFIPRDPKIVRSEEFWHLFGRYIEKWVFDRGNSGCRWLLPGGNSPESTLGHMLRTGFSSETELQLALEEFGHIEECAWAREMLRGYNE
jgi:hypothetical protein